MRLTLETAVIRTIALISNFALEPVIECFLCYSKELFFRKNNSAGSNKPFLVNFGSKDAVMDWMAWIWIKLGNFVQPTKLPC